MGELSPWHWLIVAVVVLVLFGSKKLPEAARSLGRSLRIFKSEVSSLHGDGDTSARPADLPRAAIDATPEPAAAAPELIAPEPTARAGHSAAPGDR